jgi:hypothetical protein
MKLLANLPFLALGFSATATAAPVCSVDYTITNTSDKETYFAYTYNGGANSTSFLLAPGGVVCTTFTYSCRTDCDT